MDRTILDIITALRDAQKESLTSLGQFPCGDPYGHGLQVGLYQGFTKALDLIDGVLKEETSRRDNL